MKTKFVGIAVLIALIASATAALAGTKETVLYQFSRRANGYGPQGGEVMDAQGNIYGVTNEGNSSNDTNCGVVYELSPKTEGGYTYNVIYSFTGDDDCYPYGLAIDAAGNLYGATVGGSYGEVYRLSPNGSGGWTQTVYTESASWWGISNLAVDAAGNVYGTGAFAGAHNQGFVFELSPSGASLTFQDLFDFEGTNGAGGGGGVVLDAAGNIYGTTPEGGTSTNCSKGCGVVFELKPSGGKWIESVLLNFNQTNGWVPEGGLSMDASGDLYGTTALGGAKGFGMVFELTPNGSGGWNQHVLHAFSDANGDGAQPNTTLILSGGAAYGTTASGGESTGCVTVINNVSGIGCGTVFKLALSACRWSLSTLHSFSGSYDGSSPQGVIINAAGNLFGSADGGGDTDNDGVTFELIAN